MPIEIGYGSVVVVNSGSASALRSRSRSSSAAWIGQERLDRAVPLEPGAAVRGAAGDAQLERQRARVGDHQPSARRLGEHGRLAAVPAQHGGERAEPAVLLADDRVHRERALQHDTGCHEGTRDRQIRRRPGLHVAGAASVHDAVADRPAPRVAVDPLVEVAGRDHVDVTLQDERRRSIRSRRLRRSCRRRRSPRAARPRCRESRDAA